MPRLDSLSVPRTYAQLRQAVEATLIRGQRDMDRAKLETYWRTGALIERHLAAAEQDTGYGTQTMRRLARDLDYEESVLYRCLRFARTYPNFAGRRNLLWAHYRLLLDVADPAERRSLELMADRESWTAEKLEARVRAFNAINVTPKPPDADTDNTPPKLLTPKRGTPGVCRVMADGEALAVDLGFASYLRLVSGTRFQSDDFVQVKETVIEPVREATKADLFTYTAEILKVVDGDTLWVRIFLRPDQWVKQKLRLRDLDCPEMDTVAGKAAKRYVENLVAQAETVIVSTTKPDKYDRYLADVFLVEKDETVFLNNALLTGRHAVRKNDYVPADWD